MAAAPLQPPVVGHYQSPNSGTAPKTASCTEFYEGVISVLAAGEKVAVAHGEMAAGDSDIRMLILMGAIGEAATGYVISGEPELTPELADLLIDTILDGWTGSR